MIIHEKTKEVVREKSKQKVFLFPNHFVTLSYMRKNKKRELNKKKGKTKKDFNKNSKEISNL